MTMTEGQRQLWPSGREQKSQQAGGGGDNGEGVSICQLSPTSGTREGRSDDIFKWIHSEKTAG